MSTNDITGARLVSRANGRDYEEGYDRIFKNRLHPTEKPHWLGQVIEGIHKMPNDRCVIHDNEQVEND